MNNTGLREIHVTNNDVLDLLETIIKHEEKCGYYSSKLLFSIYNFKLSEKNIFLINPIGEKVIEFQLKTYYGFIKHSNHIFLVGGKFNDSIFKYCNEPCNTLDKNKLVVIEDQLLNTAPLIEDDSMSYWYYQLINGSLKLLEKSTYCE